MREKADMWEIRRALELLFGSGPWRGFCVELRVPGTRMGTIAGYFSGPEKLADWAAKLSGGFRNRKKETVKVGAVYVTLNPLNPVILARCADRCEPFAKVTAADGDVITRRWLGLDFDPVRPAEVSSTSEEHAAALDKARRVREWLRGMGWPEPILADSGNGAHLLYRIDLPNTREATELVRRVVDAVAAFHSGEGVEVDRKVYNAGRVWKLYGTLSCKGDDLPERPHRLARILEVPEPLEVVPPEALERVASMVPQPEAGGFRGGVVGFDVEAWLEQHGVGVHSEKPWNGGRLWVLRRCPWNPEHTNLSAFVWQGPDGRVVAKCHHNSCSGKGWNDLRDLLEPGWKKETVMAQAERVAPKLPGRVAVPENWDCRVAVVTLSWELAREAYVSGKAVVVAFPDLSVPPGAAHVLREAAELEVAATAEEERAKLEWALYPLLAARLARQVQVQVQAQPAPASSFVPEQGHVTQEQPFPRPAPVLDDVDNWRPSWEEEALAWAHEHAPHLASWVLALEERARLAWVWEPDREEDAWQEWEMARRELRREWERATRRQCQEEERELSFAEVEVLMGGFDAVWDLTDAQAGALERLFREKGQVLVRAEAGWFGAEEWQKRVGYRA